MDVTVEMKERRALIPEAITTSNIPLELKTGKVHCKQGTVEHRAQVRLQKKERRCLYIVLYIYNFLVLTASIIT